MFQAVKIAFSLCIFKEEKPWKKAISDKGCSEIHQEISTTAGEMKIGICRRNIDRTTRFEGMRNIAKVSNRHETEATHAPGPDTKHFTRARVQNEPCCVFYSNNNKIADSIL